MTHWATLQLPCQDLVGGGLLFWFLVFLSVLFLNSVLGWRLQGQRGEARDRDVSGIRIHDVKSIKNQ